SALDHISSPRSTPIETFCGNSVFELLVLRKLSQISATQREIQAELRMMQQTAGVQVRI
ncbi:unnamed protein product, partial [Allacma fusca]